MAIGASRRSPQALCETARDVTSASIAGVVRWNAAEGHGVVQAISPGGGDRAGLPRHRRFDRRPGVRRRHCRSFSRTPSPRRPRRCPYGGLTRRDRVAWPSSRSRSATHVDRSDRGRGTERERRSAQHEARNVGLLAAVARGPLEIVVGDRGGEPSRAHRCAHGPRQPPAFRRAARRVVAETDRFGGTCSLILVDLDHFKSVNDQYGHEAGDAVLKHVAQVLADAVRTVDLCARYGGEEIAVLLPQTSQARCASSSPNDCERRWSGGRRATTAQPIRDDGVVRCGDLSGAGAVWRLAAARGGQGAVRGEGGRKKLREGHRAKSSHSSALQAT